MPGYLRVGSRDRDDDLPHVVAPVRPHTCTTCAHHGKPCAGACGRKVCRDHTYRCSTCTGPLCEACWTRHEVRGQHVPASPAEVLAASKPRRDWPYANKVHVRTGRFPGATKEARHG